MQPVALVGILMLAAGEDAGLPCGAVWSHHEQFICQSSKHIKYAMICKTLTRR